MSSTPSSPTTPHRHKSLRLSTDATQSPYTSGTTNGTSFSRRSSRTSLTSYRQPSPTTPRPMSSISSRRQSFQHRRKSSSRLSIGSNISLGPVDGGLGNLADELEDALEDDYEHNASSFLDGLREGSDEPVITAPHSPLGPDFDSAIAHTIQGHDTLQPYTPDTPQTSKADKRKSRHRRTESKYDGSDYGPESDQEDEEIPPILAKRMREIESLTRTSINAEDTLSEGGGVIKRTIHALKDLGPQGSVENNLTRIITAYTSMATHRTHKTRDLFSQAHSLLYASILELPEEMIDLLLADLETLSEATPVLLTQQNPLLSLQILASQTLDLAQTLRSLTDVLQESRISANTASRKLKSVKDMVEDLQTEQELKETGILLIQAGDWDRRCRERKAAATCREVCKGFGERWNTEMEDREWTRERTQMAIS